MGTAPKGHKNRGQSTRLFSPSCLALAAAKIRRRPAQDVPAGVPGNLAASELLDEALSE